MSLLHQWLESIRLVQYLENLEAGGYTTLEKCCRLTDADLDCLGINLPGHKKRILAHLPSNFRPRSMILPDQLGTESTTDDNASISSLQLSKRDSQTAEYDSAQTIPSDDGFGTKQAQNRLSGEKYLDESIYENAGITPVLSNPPPIDSVQCAETEETVPELQTKHLQRKMARPIPTPRQSIKSGQSRTKVPSPGPRSKPTPHPRQNKMSLSIKLSPNDGETTRNVSSNTTEYFEKEASSDPGILNTPNISKMTKGSENVEEETQKENVKYTLSDPVKMDTIRRKTSEAISDFAEMIDDVYAEMKAIDTLEEVVDRASREYDSMDIKDTPISLSVACADDSEVFPQSNTNKERPLSDGKESDVVCKDDGSSTKQADGQSSSSAYSSDSDDAGEYVLSTPMLTPISERPISERIVIGAEDKLDLNKNPLGLQHDVNKGNIIAVDNDNPSNDSSTRESLLEQPLDGPISDKDQELPGQSTSRTDALDTSIERADNCHPVYDSPLPVVPVKKGFSSLREHGLTRPLLPEKRAQSLRKSFSLDEMHQKPTNLPGRPLSNEYAEVKTRNSSAEYSEIKDTQTYEAMGQDDLYSEIKDDNLYHKMSNRSSCPTAPSAQHSDDIYGELWTMSTGDTLVKTSRLSEVDSNENVYTPMPGTEFDEHLSAPQLEQIKRSNEYLPGGRDSIMSFHAPHPDYPPPLLPEELQQAFTTIELAPPVIPPRPGRRYIDDTNSQNDENERRESELSRLGSIDLPNLSTEKPLPALPIPPRSGPLPDPPALSPSRTAPKVPHQWSIEDSPSLFLPLNAEDNIHSPLKHMASAWESDDTLSDGGDFYDSERDIGMEASAIPIVPSAHSASDSRKGYLFKQSSTQSTRMGWKKYWVVFENGKLRYFSNEKSLISKRIIPVVSIKNIEPNIKHNDTHPYRFKIYTIDRIYSFATDDLDDLTYWTSVIMKNVLDAPMKGFLDGGDMNTPNKAGYAKLEGGKYRPVRRYLALKNKIFCYYNTSEDFKAGCPIAELEMKLSSVKEISKVKLQMATPYITLGLTFESQDEMNSWKKAMEKAIGEGLADDSKIHEVYENPSNRMCADCGAKDPEWVSVNFCIIICHNCSGIHRMLTNPVSKIRSLTLDEKVWTPSMIRLLQLIGNENANNFWEWNVCEEDRIDSDAHIEERRVYILSKYADQQYSKKHPLHYDQHALNEKLCKTVQYGNVLDTMQLLFSGADLSYKSKEYGAEENALQLAKKANQFIQAEFLIQNGADSKTPQRSFSRMGQVSVRRISPISIKGYLYKVGTHAKDYQKRWCVLENSTFMSYDNEKSTVAKDSIMRSDLISVGITSKDQQSFQFEIGVNKDGGKIYTYATDTEGEQISWVTKIAKSFAPLPVENMDSIKNIDRGGVIFLRDGATNDWCQTWIHLKSKTLSVFLKDERRFEDIDLRKVTGIQSLQGTELCLDAFDLGPPFVIDFPKRALYIQGDLRQETEGWLAALQTASMSSGGLLVDQPMTAEEVPIAVEKCIDYISVFGMKVQGIYRLSGSHSKVTQLLQLFKDNARLVHINAEEYQIHDVANALKRYLRTLEEPLLTKALHEKWTETAGISDLNAKIQWYQYLLGELPSVHYSTLKRVILHLSRIAGFSSENKMTPSNLAAIFGPILLNVDTECTLDLTKGMQSTSFEIGVARDLINLHGQLFEVKDDEIEQERKIQEAVEKIEKAKMINSEPTVDMLVGIYINDSQGDCITLKIPPSMLAEDLVEYIRGKAQLDPNRNWSVYEVICQGHIERALHYKDRVLDCMLAWTDWDAEFTKQNYLCVKDDYIYNGVKYVFDPLLSLSAELKFSDKKRFSKYIFEFQQCKLKYYRDAKLTTPIGSWNIEDLVIYLGVEQKRSPPTKWCVTFIVNKQKVLRSKEFPFFGNTLCFSSKEELYRWLAGFLNAQHPSGLTSHNAESHITSSQELQMPSSSSLGAESVQTSPNLTSLAGVAQAGALFRKMMKR